MLDVYLSSFVRANKIKIGCKLAICDAVIQGCENGIDPLDESYKGFPFNSTLTCPVTMKIHANATRRARWDAKLGFIRDVKCMSISLHSIIPGGGNVPSLDVVVMRRYPVCFWENVGGLSSNDKKSSRVLTEHEEYEAERKYKKLCEKRVEAYIEREHKTCMKVCHLLFTACNYASLQY